MLKKLIFLCALLPCLGYAYEYDYTYDYDYDNYYEYPYIQYSNPRADPYDAYYQGQALINEERPNAQPHQSYHDVRRIMIREYNNANPDCPCPYSPDHLNRPNQIGGNCGAECMYYRPGGYHMKCYLKDIASREVFFYKLKYATPEPGTIAEIPPGAEVEVARTRSRGRSLIAAPPGFGEPLE